MPDEMIAMNFEAFDELILRFYKVKEELNETLSTINSLVDSLGANYVSDASKKLISDYNSFASNNYNVILDNLDTYISDLKAARENMSAFDSKLSVRILEENSAISSLAQER